MTSKKTADLSIICANYNNGKYLREFIQSVIESSILPYELIIVDDGSTDKSIEILRDYIHLSFLRVVEFESNKGFTAALNHALDLAQGKYIMRADPDDILHPMRIEIQYNTLQENSSIDMLGSNFNYIHADTKEYLMSSNFPIKNNLINQRYRAGGHGMAHATVCGKAHVYKSYAYQEIFPGEDYEIFARMVRDGKVLENLKNILYYVRVHPTSSTSNIKFKHIHQTFKFRDIIFGSKTGKIRVYLEYLFIKNYRGFQLHSNILKRLQCLIIILLVAPSRIVKRFLFNKNS